MRSILLITLSLVTSLALAIQAEDTGVKFNERELEKLEELMKIKESSLSKSTEEEKLKTQKELEILKEQKNTIQVKIDTYKRLESNGAITYINNNETK